MLFVFDFAGKAGGWCANCFDMKITLRFGPESALFVERLRLILSQETGVDLSETAVVRVLVNLGMSQVRPRIPDELQPALPPAPITIDL